MAPKPPGGSERPGKTVSLLVVPRYTSPIAPALASSSIFAGS